MAGPSPEFDVFLSYNRRDRQVVEPLAEALRARGPRVFKDDWYLRPGEFWPSALENKLGASGAVAVAVGRNGLGAWQQREAIAAMARPALEAVIRRPAEITRLALPDALVEHLLGDAFGQPGDLPLLEFALQRVWSDWWGGEPMLDAYRAMGRLEGAIVTHAEAVFEALDAKEQHAVPGVFAALVQVVEMRTDLCRRARLSELGEAGPRVARQLASARLLVTRRDPETGEKVVEVAHEVLLSRWPMLEDWIRERRDALRTVRQLQTDARSWLTHHKDSGGSPAGPFRRTTW